MKRDLHSMHPMSRLCGLFTLILLSTLAYSQSERSQPLTNYPQARLTIDTPAMRRHVFNVWVADTDERRQEGLMFVRALPKDTGMLFLFERTQRVSMWMKNTYIPLDMVFIRPDGVVDSIAANTTPFSLDIVASQGAINAVLELAGGSARELGITAGSRVTLAER